MLAFASASLLWATDKPEGLSVENDAMLTLTHAHKSFLRTFEESGAFLQKRPSRNPTPAGVRRSLWFFLSRLLLREKERVTFTNLLPKQIRIAVCRFFVQTKP